MKERVNRENRKIFNRGVWHDSFNPILHCSLKEKFIQFNEYLIHFVLMSCKNNYYIVRCSKTKGLPEVFYNRKKNLFKQSWGQMLMCNHFRSTLGSFVGRRLWLDFDWLSLGTCSIDYEIQRQMEVLQSAGKVLNETRAFDSKSGWGGPEQADFHKHCILLWDQCN